MSAKAFRDILNRVPELKYWAYGKKDTSSILHQTRSSSKEEIRKSSVEHIIPLSQLTSILGGDSVTARGIFNEIKSGRYITGHEDVTYNNINGQETIIFHKINFDRLNKDVAKYLDSIAIDAKVSTTTGSIEDRVLESVSKNKYQKGHVFGWANTLVNRTKASIADTLLSRSGISDDQLKLELSALNSFIDNLLDVLEDYDISSSSIAGLDGTLFAKYRKTSSNWLIEWQLDADNQRSGSEAATALGKSSDTGVRGFLKNVGLNSAKKLVDSALAGMVSGFMASVDLGNLQSSPTMVQLVHDELVSTITGKKKVYKNTYTGSIDNIAKATLRKVENKEAKASILKAKASLKQLKTRVANTSRNIKTTAKSAINLEAILRSRINEQVRQNMGGGTESRILNYRTGRFAESVSIERISESRQGMISVFYNYMKNPYATFSDGGRQQYPKTRDPKALISKSIREIAGPMVANRLRSVVV